MKTKIRNKQTIKFMTMGLTSLFLFVPSIKLHAETTGDQSKIPTLSSSTTTGDKVVNTPPPPNQYLAELNAKSLETTNQGQSSVVENTKTPAQTVPTSDVAHPKLINVPPKLVEPTPVIVPPPVVVPPPIRVIATPTLVPTAVPRIVPKVVVPEVKEQIPVPVLTPIVVPKVAPVIAPILTPKLVPTLVPTIVPKIEVVAPPHIVYAVPEKWESVVVEPPKRVGYPEHIDGTTSRITDLSPNYRIGSTDTTPNVFYDSSGIPMLQTSVQEAAPSGYINPFTLPTFNNFKELSANGQFPDIADINTMFVKSPHLYGDFYSLLKKNNLLPTNRSYKNIVSLYASYLSSGKLNSLNNTGLQNMVSGDAMSFVRSSNSSTGTQVLEVGVISLFFSFFILKKNNKRD